MATTDSSTTYSRDVSWYLPGPPRLRDDIKKLLVNWSGIDPANDGIEKHVERVREKAWEVHQYPCSFPIRFQDHPPFPRSDACFAVGGYRFVSLHLAAHPSFDAIVAQLKSLSEPSCKFVDLGCCVAQDLRSLAVAGVPSDRLVGVDTEPAFIEIGYELFRDRAKLAAPFIICDVVSPDHPITDVLAPLVGHTSVLWASSFLHLWGLADQTAICRGILPLLHHAPGSRIVGRQVGSASAGEIRHGTNKSGMMYKHNPASFRKMWAEVLGCEESDGEVLESKENGKWEVKAWFVEDQPADVQPRSESGDWMTTVSLESSGISRADADKGAQSAAPSFAENRVLFLVWEVKKVE